MANNMPFIKNEPDDFSGHHFNFNSPQYRYQGQFSGSIDPSELSMGTNGAYHQPANFHGHNMTSSFNAASNGFGEDELMASLNPDLDVSTLGQPINMNYGQMNTIYSNTPDGAPIQSPFVSGFDYSQFRPMNSLPQHQHAPYMQKRPSAGQTRKISSGPMTPRTAAMANLHLGTPDSGGMPQNGRAIKASSVSTRHQKTGSRDFDGTPGSLQSYLDSPLLSPSSMMHHTG